MMGKALVAKRTFYRCAPLIKFVLVGQITAFRTEDPAMHAQLRRCYLSSTSATLMMILATHLSEESPRLVHVELHGVAAALQVGHSRASIEKTNLLKNKSPQLPCEKGRRHARSRPPRRVAPRGPCCCRRPFGAIDCKADFPALRSVNSLVVPGTKRPLPW